MKAECVNPFLQALQDVFKIMLDVDITRDNIHKGDAVNENQVVVEIPLIGDIQGSVLFSFPQSTTFEIVKTMSGMEFDKIDSFVTSALGEMANIISGNALSYLAKGNYQCDILPPRIEITEHEKGETALTLPLHTDVGDLRIKFVL